MTNSAVLGSSSLKVTVVGCGNIGSRLLQSLARVRGLSLEIYGVEPSESARQVAAARFEEARGDRPHRLTLAGEADTGGALGIVATDSRNRLAALRLLESQGMPKTLVLEKFLFTRAAEYSEATNLLDQAGANAWVNCSRSEWPGYIELRDRLASQTILAVSVKGSDWGLACNGIHYLALIEFLTRSRVAEIDWDAKPVVREAKRLGYMELVGSLRGRTESGTYFSVSSLPTGDLHPEVVVNTDSERIVVRESKGVQIVTTQGTRCDMPFQALLASQLDTVFEKLLLGRETTLPRYSEGARLHLMAMALMNEGFFGTRSLELECPVT